MLGPPRIESFRPHIKDDVMTMSKRLVGLLSIILSLRCQFHNEISLVKYLGNIGRYSISSEARECREKWHLCRKQNRGRISFNEATVGLFFPLSFYP